MQLINEDLYNSLHEQIPTRLVLVYNKEIKEYLYLLLDEEESKKIDPQVIREFVKNQYISKFKIVDFQITYYKKTTENIKL